jgi:hypothetical protein
MQPLWWSVTTAYINYACLVYHMKQTVCLENMQNFVNVKASGICAFMSKLTTFIHRQIGKIFTVRTYKPL